MTDPQQPPQWLLTSLTFVVYALGIMPWAYLGISAWRKRRRPEIPNDRASRSAWRK